jgi:hypothetical protein
MMLGMDGIDSVASPVKWEGIKNLNEPALPVLAEFVHGCSKDPATRTASLLSLQDSESITQV